MKKEALKSFIKLVRRGCVEDVLLIETFSEFAKSGSEDAYEFYVSKGLHNLCEPISDIQICSWIHKAMLENPSCSFEKLVGTVMRISKGKLNPNTVKEKVVQFLLNLE